MQGNSVILMLAELVKLKGNTFSPPDVIFTAGFIYHEYLLTYFDLATIYYLLMPVNIYTLKKAENHCWKHIIKDS
jgi:hypothetical protein